MTFDSFAFPSVITKNIAAMGYTSPTPIQTQAMPSVMQGRDLMGLAQTGTGKTAAFLLPIITRLMKKPQTEGQPRRAYRRPRALILAPTRELAEQIHEAAQDLGRGAGVRSTTVYGGVNMNRQITALRNGADIVVACPGRLLDHMGQRTVDLTKVEVLVLDEADQMFDMGFLPDIRKIIAALPRQRQTLLFSATMPEAIRGLAAECLSSPETVRAGDSAPAETVSHAIYPVSQHLKTPLLLEMMRRFGTGSVLVFTRTKHRAKRVAEQLAKAGHPATALQGNLSQNRRKEAMDGFRDGRFRIMVATDIAARGIDVSLVEHVVNYDVPTTPEIYTHRIGRTGRASRTGEAHTFVTAEDVSMVRAIERLLREPLKRKKVEGFDYNQAAPARDTEFARPPLQPRGRQGQQRPRDDRGQQRQRDDRAPRAWDDRAPRAQAEPGQRTEGGQRRQEGQGGQRAEGGQRRQDGQYARDGQRRPEGQGQQRRVGYANGNRFGAPSGNSDGGSGSGYSSRPMQPGDDIYAEDRPRGGRPGQNRHGQRRGPASQAR